MAMNPMQRKIRNAFLFGFLVALLIGAVAVGLLIMQNKKAKEELVKTQEANKLAMKQVYAVQEDIKANEAVKAIEISLPSQYVPDNAITSANLDEYMNDDGELEMISKVAMTKNTVLTTDVVTKSQEASTYRMVEYNMISLPSKLEEGNYIDIRLACLGYDCVVLSKIQVESCNSTTIWLKLSESQMLTLNYAIIESYIMDGTKLYATQYTDETQPPLNATYVPDDNTIELIKSNISEDGQEWETFYERAGNENALKFRNEIISSLRGEQYSEDDVEAINEGYEAEKTNIQAARDALMGDLGY